MENWLYQMGWPASPRPRPFRPWPKAPKYKGGKNFFFFLVIKEKIKNVSYMYFFFPLLRNPKILKLC